MKYDSILTDIPDDINKCILNYKICKVSLNKGEGMGIVHHLIADEVKPVPGSSSQDTERI